LIDSELIRKIKPSEWLKKDQPNITKYTDRFNMISGWVKSMVVLSPTPQMRVIVVNRFLQTVMECFSLNNFTAVMGIYTGLMSDICYKLFKRTSLDKPTKTSFAKLSKIAELKGNFKELNSIQEAVQTPCVPFLVGYIGMIALIKEGKEEFISEGIINFEQKYRMISTVIETAEHFRSHCNYQFTSVEFLNQYLQNNLLILSETTLNDFYPSKYILTKKEKNSILVNPVSTVKKLYYM